MTKHKNPALAVVIALGAYLVATSAFYPLDFLSVYDAKRVLQLILFVVVLIFTPWYLGDSPEFYAPAVVVILMELLLEGAAAELKGGIALLASLFVMLCFLTLRLLLSRKP